jgi:hypothetical protein
LFRIPLGRSIAAMESDAKGAGLNAVYVYLRRQALAIWRLLEGPDGERGQGTVEYVGLILLVSLLMVGMVAAMKGFNGTQGTELAELIVTKIKSAVNAISFK